MAAAPGNPLFNNRATKTLSFRTKRGFCAPVAFAERGICFSLLLRESQRPLRLCVILFLLSSLFCLHPYFLTSLPRLLTPPPSQTLPIRRFSLPASPHYSPPSLPTVPPALPSPRSRSYRWQPPHCSDLRRRLLWVRFRSPLAPRRLPLLPPAPRCSPRLSILHPPAQIPHHSPALPAPAPRTPSSSATPPNRSIQTASKIPSTSCTKSAAPSLPSAPPS